MNRTQSMLFGFVAVFAFGCAGLMPSTERRSSLGKPPWKNHAEAESSAKKIEVGKTTFDELRKLSWDPYKIPNTKILRDVRTELLPHSSSANTGLELLPREAQACYKNFIHCKGYRFNAEVIHIDGRGNLILRALHVKKEDVTTGWRFELDIYLMPRKYFEPFPEYYNKDLGQDELVVVLMLAGGQPNIQSRIIRKNPLGFFGTLSDASRSLIGVGPRIDSSYNE